MNGGGGALSNTVIQKHTQQPTYLIAGPAFEAVRIKLVDMENMNGTLDTEVMELARHFKE